MSGCASSRPRPAWGSLVAAAVALPAVAGAPADVLRIDGRPAEQAVIVPGETWDESWPLDTVMGRQLAGVLARYEDVGPLERCVTRGTVPPEGLEAAQRLGVIHLTGGNRVKQVEILRLAGGTAAIRALPAGDEAPARLNIRAFEHLVASWSAYRGSFGPATDPLGESFVLAQPYVPGSITMKRGVMKQRIYRRQPVKVEDADRILADETMHVRLPGGYDPRQPAGLVVWSSPTPDGRIPDAVDTVLDELNMVCIAADNAGNDRDVPDKFQLVFDAVATARARYHIDDTRIYMAGLSGGGKVSSILTICFAEIFAGAVAIVGFGSYHELGESWGEHRMPYYTKPRGIPLKTARSRRMAVMTGPPDFNYREMVQRANWMLDDGFGNVRLFIHEDMTHEMPTPSRFVEALSWADAPSRRQREKEQTLAASQLSAYLDGRENPAPHSPEDRVALIGVIEVGPWSDAAWQAMGMLRESRELSGMSH